ncbi:MAG: tyrosyl-tRNA synthetase [Pseudomonadota bacterium]
MHVLDELEARGFVKQVVDAPGLRARMDAGPITFYAGFDPTADSLHVGNLLPMMMMAHLQRAGHRAIVVVGGGTGMVGDPSGKTEARKLLDEAAIAHNIACQKAQLGRVLDVTDPSRGALLNNADWLMSLNYIAFLREIGSAFSVNRMLAAEGYRQRLERGLSFIEFNYQLLQAYDFLVLHREHGCELQIGGDDQWGNILAGVDLIRRKAEAPAWALTLPLLVTATGEKMGKTHGGAVWLSRERFAPFDFYQYWLNVDDRDAVRFLRLYTFLPLDEIEAYDGLRGAAVRETKARLAWEVTALLHGVDAANQARDAAAAMTSATASSALPTLMLAPGGAPWLLAAVIADAKIEESRSAARRAIQGGGVRLDDERVTDPNATISAEALGQGCVLRVGKSRAVRLVLGT